MRRVLPRDNILAALCCPFETCAMQLRAWNRLFRGPAREILAPPKFLIGHDVLDAMFSSTEARNRDLNFSNVTASDSRLTSMILEDMMRQLLHRVDRFIRSEDGPTAVEYAVMLALIIVVSLVAISSLGSNTKTTFTNVANSIGS